MELYRLRTADKTLAGRCKQSSFIRLCKKRHGAYC